MPSLLERSWLAIIPIFGVYPWQRMQKLSIHLRFICLFLLVLFAHFSAQAQQKGVVYGVVQDSLGAPVPYALISDTSRKFLVETDQQGRYMLELPANQAWLISIRVLNYKEAKFQVTLKPGQRLQRDILMRQNQLADFTIIERGNQDLSVIEISTEGYQQLPVPGDAITALIRAEGIGVAAGNELSSGYSVRGGNFDENLTYVNGMEIYRPFLARAGQQEGLSFINPDMVESIEFSAGGFEARFGDKMSSVLNVRYRKPSQFRANASLSFLGGTAHVEDAILKNRLKYNIAYRYKSNNYLLSGLDTRGDYQPVFQDVQAYLAYDPHEDWELSFLGSFSDNNFIQIPQDRETQFGHVQEAKQLRVFFEGQELTRFQVASGAGSITWKPGNWTHKAYANIYRTVETEAFDVQGQYFLGEVESDLADPNFGEVVNTTGFGTFLNHARNRMDGVVAAFGYQGQWERPQLMFNPRTDIQFQWGAEYKREQINDRLNEWGLLDSSGYLLPYEGPADLGSMELEEVRNSTAELNSQRIQAFFQSRFQWKSSEGHRWYLNAGGRAHYWDLNQQLLLSPRVQMGVQPLWKRRFSFRIASGIYYQAPFYRELRDFQGNLNTKVKAQQAIHVVAGMDFDFKWWNRPFRLTAEAYYKQLNDLNPYKIDNVRIRYEANNNAQGYAAGFDVKLNGQFIPGLESYVTLGILQTMEDIEGDTQTLPDGSVAEIGFIPRPTDQRLNVGLFFQDNLPNLEQCRVHLSLLLGTQLPFGPPGTQRAADTLRSPMYRRVDIGFSYVFISPNKKEEALWRNGKVGKHIKSFWASLEFFNLLDINNTISYLWIRDVSGRRYAVPNYLTPRLINLKLVLELN